MVSLAPATIFKPLTLSLLCLAISSAFAQKVKYKDLYELLRTKQYETAEPFLKRYLADNDDNPNAFLFMGIIYQEKSLKADLLKETDKMVSFIDSALLFYDKAHKTIDDREIRRNDEYYEAYNRRDLRTGEYGVNLSDIQFDLEKKKEDLKQRIADIRTAKALFLEADSLYARCQSAYLRMKGSSAGEKEFLLRADESTIAGLKALSLRFDSCLNVFERYSGKLSQVGHTSYNQAVTLVEIKDFKNNGTSPADFYANDLQLWNYKEFGDRERKAIEEDILPTGKRLVEYDIELNKLREKMSTDSVSVRSDLAKLVDQLLLPQLKKYDPDPMPSDLFGLRITDLEYHSMVLEHSKVRDSTNVYFQRSITREEASVVRKLDSLATRLQNRNLDEDIANYSYFVTVSFHNAMLLKSYCRTMKEYADRELARVERDLAEREQAFKWIIVENDSIPLDTTILNRAFKPLHVEREQFTVGLHYKDSLSAEGYLCTITPSRNPDVNVSFPVDRPNFKGSRFPTVSSLQYTDPAAQLFIVLVFSTNPVKNAFPATIAKIYRTDGLSWSTNLSLAFIPTILNYRIDAGEIQLTAPGLAAPITIDKNGKLVK